ncbi:hypothetical protein H6G00_00670 [Leptolyngbya sp. FACHB-541]|uniref:phage tail tube protein n=1 Tax=Leptolyngbya sp. FACHB-541 TaxID=2692810 RepID=UPI001684B3D0|nr:hypothetical protein [Leptolyngbya sp. FACHB-541]MBD1995140.1 hypothetical protein [Leptolyngbya sp. FACHB-541]
MSTINYQTEVVITEGTKLDIGWLMRGTRTPASYILTVGTAAVLNDEVLSVTSSVDNLLIQAGTKLSFGNQIVIVTTDTIVDATTPTDLPIRALGAPIAANATATTRALLTVLGLTDASPSGETQVEDTSNFLSGFGNEGVIVGVNRTVQCSGNVIVGDRAMDRIIKPLILDDEKARREIYADLQLPSGERYQGAAKIQSFSSPSANRSIQKFQFQLMFQGLSFKHTPATTYAAIAQDAA